jgi:hypothetical protein
MLELHTCVEASMSWNHILVLLLLNIWPFSLLMLLALELECQFTAIALSNKQNTTLCSLGQPLLHHHQHEVA